MGRTSVQAVRRAHHTSRLRDRHRDQRKRIIKMCVKKLRDIDDPETVLCRAVLINNTFRTLKTAQRQLLRKSRRRTEQQDSSEEEEEEEEDEEEEEEEEVQDVKEKELDISSTTTESPLPSLSAGDTSNDSFEESSLEGIGDCDALGCSETSLVHALIMPPLLSPHIEDMTNCSFYDSFGPVQLEEEEPQKLNSSSTQFSSMERERDSSIKLMKSTLCDVIGENNSNSHQGGGFHQAFQKSEFGGCGAHQGETGDSLLDNLLTEIAQA